VTQTADAEVPAGAAHPPSRRDRLRAATMEEIIQTARRLLVSSGPEAMTLRAIAREMGMTAPGLYRYFDSHEELNRHVCATFFALFLELWNAVPVPVPEDADIDPGLRDQLRRYRDALGTDLPLGAVLTFLRCWTVLYGAVAMEVFGHLSFALEDPAPMFELTLGDLATLVGLRYPLQP